MVNRSWIAVLLAVPALSFAQGIPENCRAPMANVMELSAIPQLLHLPSDGPKIMGIVPTGNSHAREISNGRYRIDCTISVSWEDGHVDRNYHFSAWEEADGGYGGEYGPPPLNRPSVRPPATRAQSPQEPSEKMSKPEFDAIVNETASKIAASATMPDGTTIVLSNQRSDCPAHYLGAIALPSDDSSPSVSGCWTYVPSSHAVVVERGSTGDHFSQFGHGGQSIFPGSSFGNADLSVALRSVSN